MAVTAPQPERIELLRRTYRSFLNPVLAPRLLETKDALFDCLHQMGKEPERWGEIPGSRSFDDIWSEYEENENILAFVPVEDGEQEGHVGRFIRTVTLYITRDLPHHDQSDPRNRALVTPEVLREHVIWPDGSVYERPFANSGSEKLRWHEHGPNDAIRRFLKEELSLEVPRKHRQPPHMVMVPPGWDFFRGGVATAAPEVDVHESRSYPGIVTYNQLFHHIWKMPRKYWSDTYREVQKNKILEFRWRSTYAPRTEKS